MCFKGKNKDKRVYGSEHLDVQVRYVEKSPTFLKCHKSFIKKAMKLCRLETTQYTCVALYGFVMKRNRSCHLNILILLFFSFLSTCHKIPALHPKCILERYNQVFIYDHVFSWPHCVSFYITYIWMSLSKTLWRIFFHIKYKIVL